MTCREFWLLYSNGNFNLNFSALGAYYVRREEISTKIYAFMIYTCRLVQKYVRVHQCLTFRLTRLHQTFILMACTYMRVQSKFLNQNAIRYTPVIESISLFLITFQQCVFLYPYMLHVRDICLNSSSYLFLFLYFSFIRIKIIDFLLSCS